MILKYKASKIKITNIEGVERLRELELRLRFDKQIEVLNQGINLCVNQNSSGNREQSKAARIP